MESFSEAPPDDPKVGEKIFKAKCAQCYTIDKGPGHKQVWYNFGYSYSAANKNMAVNWEEKTLYDYLLSPKKHIPWTKMVFPRLKKP